MKKMKLRRKHLLLAGLLLLVLAATAWWWWQHSHAARRAPAPPEGPVSVVNGLTVVTLKPAVQKASGLREQTVGAATSAAAGSTAYGVVMDVQPLVDWRGQYATAQAQDRAARTQWTVARAELERLRKLHADDQNASLKAVQAAQAEEEKARSAAAAAVASLRVLLSNALQQFGPVLAGWAQGRPGPMQQLLAHKASLVGIALGDGAPPATLQVSVGSGPRWSSNWIGRSVRADPKLGAGLQVYLVPAGLTTNAAVIAWLPAPGAADSVLVPLPAVVWFADQPWAYVRRDGSHFARVPLLDATETPDGYVARGGVTAGSSVVTQGAGLLLSQEQTPPPNAAPCKDPECDD